jgi:hypothetical protein
MLGQTRQDSCPPQNPICEIARVLAGGLLRVRIGHVSANAGAWNPATPQQPDVCKTCLDGPPKTVLSVHGVNGQQEPERSNPWH